MHAQESGFGFGEEGSNEISLRRCFSKMTLTETVSRDKKRGESRREVKHLEVAPVFVDRWIFSPLPEVHSLSIHLLFKLSKDPCHHFLSLGHLKMSTLFLRLKSSHF